MMKVLLTNAPLQHYHRTAFFFRDQGAINLPTLASAIDAEHEVRILDNWHYLFRFEGIFREIERFGPDVVGISHSSEVDTENVYAVARKIKRLHPGTIVVGGGQYLSVYPEEALANGFDYIVRGEGESTLPELLRAIRGDVPLRGVGGISFMREGVLVATPDRPPGRLNDRPYPLLKYLPAHRSWYFPGKRTSVIEVSRGCPFTCDFCSVTSYFGHRWEKRENAGLIREIRRIKEGLGVDHFYFLDESWGIRPTEYAEFCQKLIDERLDIKWYPSGMRTDTIVKNPDLVRLAARAGMYGTLVGFESYSESTLSSVNKQSNLRNNYLASEILRKNGVIVYGVHIYGLPGEADFRPTFREGSRQSDIFTASMFAPLPGTPLFKRAQADGVLEKIPLNERLYFYSHFMGGAGRDRARMTRAFLYWHARYHVSPRTLWKTLTSRGVMGRFHIADYLSCIQYFWFLLLRRLKGGVV